MNLLACFARMGALSLALLAAPLTAQEAAPSHLLLELNNAEDHDSGHCRLTLLTENATGHDIGHAAWQFAIFDQDGRVRALPVIDFGALPKGKTRLVAISIPGRACDQIRRIVVNDVAECQTEDETFSDICLSQLQATSRVAIAFGL